MEFFIEFIYLFICLHVNPLYIKIYMPKIFQLSILNNYPLECFSAFLIENYNSRVHQGSIILFTERNICLLNGIS